MKFNKNIKIGNKIISDTSQVFIIAEAGVNHNGNIKLAIKLIDTAAQAGADAVKFQAFKSENLALKNIKKAKYQVKTTGNKGSQFDMLKKLELTKVQNKKLVNYCKRKNIIFLTTPYDEQSLDELDSLNLPAYKVASTDLTNLPFLKKIAKKGKTIILSTGMSYLSEIEMALCEIHPINKNVILLQCTGNYPITDDEANLNVINTFKDKFNVLVGYSDHSVGIGASPYSVPMGVRLVEKHFTLDKKLKGPDHKASLTPDELKEFVKKIRKVEEYLGSSIKTPSFTEFHTRRSLQRCLVAKINIKKGQKFSEKNITAKRTGGEGISPIYYRNLLDKTASKNYNKDKIINE